MKVKELIVLLQRENPNADVVVVAPEGTRYYADIEPKLDHVPVDSAVVIVPKT